MAKTIKCQSCEVEVPVKNLKYNEAEHEINVCVDCAAEAVKLAKEEKVKSLIESGLSKKEAKVKAESMTFEKRARKILLEAIEQTDMDEEDPDIDETDEVDDVDVDDEDEVEVAVEQKKAKTNKVKESKEEKEARLAKEAKAAARLARSEKKAKTEGKPAKVEKVKAVKEEKAVVDPATRKLLKIEDVDGARKYLKKVDGETLRDKFTAVFELLSTCPAKDRRPVKDIFKELRTEMKGEAKAEKVSTKVPKAPKAEKVAKAKVEVAEDILIAVPSTKITRLIKNAVKIAKLSFTKPKKGVDPAVMLAEAATSLFNTEITALLLREFYKASSCKKEIVAAVK